jgi:hypothetical protein
MYLPIPNVANHGLVNRTAGVFTLRNKRLQYNSTITEKDETTSLHNQVNLNLFVVAFPVK